MSFYRESEFSSFGKRDEESFTNRAARPAAYQRNDMAKKKDQAQESAPAPQAQDPAGAAQAAAQEENLSKEGEAPKAPAQPERRPEGIALGRIVVYYRGENTGFSTKLNAIVGVIVGFPSPTDNFQPKDGAVHIKLFGLHGDEVRKGVMYAHGGPKDGRWVFATEHKA